MSVAIGIVGHTTRSRHAEALARRVHGFVAIDNGEIGCDGNHRSVIDRLAADPADWLVVLEDDAVPVRAFGRHLKTMLPFAPSGLVSLYLGRQRPPQYQSGIAAAVAEADEVDASWIVASRLLHGVGYAIRANLAESLLNFSSRLPIDEHISAWAQLHGHLVSYTWPSLVDHADMPTIVAHPDGQPRPPGRVAWRTGWRENPTTTSVSLVT